jgi:hypothetical protein
MRLMAFDSGPAVKRPAGLITPYLQINGPQDRVHKALRWNREERWQYEAKGQPVLLLSIAKGQTHDIQDWTELQTPFRVSVTQNIETVQSFFCLGLEPHAPFSLDRQ